MPLPNTLSAYADIAADLNALLPEGGRRICPNSKAAYRWRHRANKFRALLREQSGTTPYDQFTFKIEDNVVSVVVETPGGHLETFSGEKINPVETEDELLDEAKALAKELGLE